MSAEQTAPLRAAAAGRSGLSQAEAEARLARRGPLPPAASSRSYRSIVRANVLTVFNLILLVFGILTIAFGDWRDALFLTILVANAGIGIVQEVRAKRALDRLAALVAPRATAVRDGRPRVLAVEEVVVGDLLRVEAGDQVVADGRLERASGLRLDESILTGESDAVARRAGDELRSGTFVVEGGGEYVVSAVGAGSYAARLAGQAAEFRHPRSPLERAVNRLLFVLVGVMVPLGAILGYALWERQTPTNEAVSTSVAAVVTLVPEGLILLTSLTYAVAALRMTRRGALSQQLNAIESLASVDMICIDKTGTLTEPRLRVVEALPAAGVTAEQLETALARYAASAAARNATLAAIAEALPGEPDAVREEVPFSSRRRWSGIRFAGEGLVMAAPELVPLGELEEHALREASRGRRVVALAQTRSALDEEAPPRDLRPLGVVVIAERLRAQARETVAFLRDQGVELKVLSGDRPETVAAIAADAGIAASGALDGRALPEDPLELRRVALDAAVIGRISPEGKRRVVEALRDSGRYVAMVGDGVNDVPALKAARLAIAQGTGSQMARSVADLVLVSGDFAVVPSLVGEGRRIFANLARVAKLFVTKSAFAAFLIVSIGLTPLAYPLLPRQLTLAATLTIGIPAFFLALAPNAASLRSAGLLREIGRFAVPGGTAAGLGVLSSYLFASQVLDLPLREARTVATTALVAIGLYLIVVLEASGRRRSAAVTMLCLGLVILYALTLATGATRDFCALAVPSPAAIVTAACGVGMAVAGLWLTDDRFVPGRGAEPRTAVDGPPDGGRARPA